MLDSDKKRIERCIFWTLKMLNNWKAGKVIISVNEQDLNRNIILLNNYMSEIEFTLLEAITPVEKIKS